jgi:hypothetical protein
MSHLIDTNLNGVDTPMLKEMRAGYRHALAKALKQGSPSKRDEYEAKIELIQIELDSRTQ